VTPDIPPGPFVGVIGRSGAGKSTLLRLVNRLINPTTGPIKFDARQITGLRGRDLRACAMTFRQVNLVDRLDMLTVLVNPHTLDTARDCSCCRTGSAPVAGTRSGRSSFCFSRWPL